jgi:hypothetical protein
MRCETLISCVLAPLQLGFMQRGLLAAILIAIVLIRNLSHLYSKSHLPAREHYATSVYA